mgnify:CR=1 FL=1
MKFSGNTLQTLYDEALSKPNTGIVAQGDEDHLFLTVYTRDRKDRLASFTDGWLDPEASRFLFQFLTPVTGDDAQEGYFEHITSEYIAEQLRLRTIRKLRLLCGEDPD